MLKKANSNQELLLDVLNKLFVYMTDPQTKKKIIRINPELSEELLEEAIIETRAIIINLYLTCETDFANGIKIYEAIVDKKIIETAKSQIETMENSREKLVMDEEIPKPAELKELKEIADRKIQKQKEKVANEEIKIQKEEEKIEIVKPVIQEVEQPQVIVEQPTQKIDEPAQVKVKINVQGLNEAKGLSEAITNDETKGETETQTPLIQAAGSRKYKRKCKPKSKTRKVKK
jgi:outer membrane biosynthesis protein TonB